LIIQKKFNYSAINNFATKFAKGELFLFLNDDMEVINNDWLEALVEQAQRKEVGGVGCKLIYPNNTIQHAGVILDKSQSFHAFKNWTKQEKLLLKLSGSS
jgi:GT2 family glycosyltransferase